VEFVDTDMAGIVHFSNFFRWMESAEVDFLHARGLSVKLPWEGLTLGFPRVSASCDYLKPIGFEDVIEITVQIERLGTKSVTFAFEFFHEGVKVARGKVTSVCCRVGPGQQIEAVEIPESLKQQLQGGANTAPEKNR
jgi:YbgC/YbaW family acyl-CoA thioester hydrolase